MDGKSIKYFYVFKTIVQKIELKSDCELNWNRKVENYSHFENKTTFTNQLEIIPFAKYKNIIDFYFTDKKFSHLIFYVQY